MTPIQQLMLGVGAKKKTYMDDVFSTYLYTGQSSTKTITNGIDNLGQGGMLWVKNRDNARGHQLYDTERLASGSTTTSDYSVSSDSSGAARDMAPNGIITWKSDGWSVPGGDGDVNQNGFGDYASWNFRKAPGFFDVITYTGNGTAGRTLSHSLGCVPGLVLIKQTNSTQDWVVYHRSLDTDKKLKLNGTDAQASTSSWNSTRPTSTTITLGAATGVNGANHEFVAYVFGGGESTNALARSLTFDGSYDSLQLASSSDFNFGTGDFTFEGWLKPNNNTNFQVFLNWGSDNPSIGISNDSNSYIYYNSTVNTKIAGIAAVGQWTHYAISRSSGTTRLFLNGDLKNSFSDSHNYGAQALSIGAYINGNNSWNGSISNVRIVKGTAVYTSSFRPPTEPLTNITNTVLLCCNNSSPTGSTVAPGTITAENNVTASTDSPFDDPAGFVFGDSKEGIIKTGSYVGNGDDAEDIDVYLGWEPRWLLVKQTVNSGNWQLVDSATSWPVSGNWETLRPNLNQAANDSTETGIQLTATGFKVVKNYGNFNTNGDTHVFMAIRFSDGYVGKSRTATELFAIDTGNGSTAGPTFDSGFPVDWALRKDSVVSGGSDWISYQRILGLGYLRTNTNDAATDSARAKWDFMTGMNHTDSSTTYAWMWKRHAGFDVVAYKGSGLSAGQQQDVPHSMNKTPEMMWVKIRDASNQNWMVYHKDLNSGTNPEQYKIELNSSGAESSFSCWDNTAPNATSFRVGNQVETNHGSHNFIAMLFSSTDVSKVGSYTGDDSDDGSHVIDVGFTPRFLIIKRADGSADWKVFDTTNGFPTSGTANYLELNTTDARYAGSGVTVTKDTNGFKLWSPGSPYNANNAKYIYYAHA